jgi:hypothetical protein
MGHNSRMKGLMIHVYIDYLQLFLWTERAPKVVQCISETPYISALKLSIELNDAYKKQEPEISHYNKKWLCTVSSVE